MTITFKDLNLNPKILKALDACGYEKPTPVQAKSIPEILAGNDLVASAQTGTGKTAAFVLPALQLLSESEAQKKPRVLILTPTRELAAQITKAASQYGKFLNFNIVSLVGGMGYPQQVKQLTRAVDVIVATPGRLLDHMGSRRVDLSQVEMLILDEADRMLDMGFIDDVKEIAKATSANRQTLLFSATLNQQLNHVIKQLLKDPVRIDFAHEAISPDRIKQVLYFADNAQHKTKIIEHLLQSENIFKAIIFTATKKSADELAQALRDDGFAAAALHGDLKQAARNRTVEQLRRGKVQYVVATDVAARGIDISDLTHVINYDLPRFSEDYVHRIGRTGRAGKTGLAISVVLPSEARHLQKIERYIDQKVEIEIIPGLEPKKNHSAASAAPKKSKGKSPARGGARSEGRRDGARSEGRRDGARSEGRRDGARSEGRRDGARSEGRRDGARSEGRRDGARSEGRRDGARSEGRRDGVRSEGRREGARSEGRRDGVRRDDARRDGARTEGRREGARSEGRRDGARTEGRREGVRRDDARRDGVRSEGRRDGVRRDDSRRDAAPKRSDDRRDSRPAKDKKRAPKKPGKKY